MSDGDTEYGSSEGSTDATKSLILYPVLASVFSAFCIISIAIFLLSNRKCCKRKTPDDAESALLKQRLLNEQKRMAAYRFRLLFEQRPVFCSIMQQEENDIADEVKESYKMISTTVNKPIICCPDKRNSYVYNPIRCPQNEKVEHLLKAEQNIRKEGQSEKMLVFKELPSSAGDIDVEADHTDVEADHTDVEMDSLNGQMRKPNDKEFIFEENNVLFDSLKKTLPDSTRQSLKKIDCENFFTESEIENVSDLKSLFFKKWINKNNDWIEGSSHHTTRDFANLFRDDDNDDLDSILTSISRMDSCRMQRLRDSKFYKHLMTQMSVIDAGETPCMGNIDDEVCSMNSLLNCKDETNLTHEELLQAVIHPESTVMTHHKKDERSDECRHFQNFSEDGSIRSVCRDSIQTNTQSLEYKHREKIVQRANKSPILSRSPTCSSSESKSSVTNNTSLESTSKEETSSTSLNSYNSSLTISRPKSLDLKRRYTELNIDVPFTHKKSSFSESTKWISGDQSSEDSSLLSSSSTAISQETDKVSGQTGNSNSVAGPVSSSFSYGTPSQKSNTSDTSQNLLKKYRKPGKYKAPRNTQKLKKQIFESNRHSEVSSSSDVSSLSRVKQQRLKDSTAISSKYRQEFKESKQLPKFVTGSKQNYKKNKKR